MLEGACCGYGASGRNGGFRVATSLIDRDLKDPEARKKNLNVSLHGIAQIKECIDLHGLDCDFKENGMLDNEFTSHAAVNRKIPYAGPRVLRSYFGHLKKWYMVNVDKFRGHV